VKTPALDAWRQEFRDGKRTGATFDVLWRAACEEAKALEAQAAGLPGLAVAFLRDARAIVVAEVRRRRSSAA
jgi:hypothetical protein